MMFYLQVCDYHKEFYRPENLCLIITGQVEPEQVFAALQPFEEKILAKVLYFHSHLFFCGRLCA